MPRIQRSALVPYSAEEMYQLVADIPSYGDFLPWCGGARILQQDENQVTAEVDICYKSVNKSFTTINQLEYAKQITMALKEGPFSKLQGTWRFSKLDEQASKIELDLEFDFSNRLAGAVIGPVFSLIANGMVDAFHKRATQLYGMRTV